MIEPVPFRRFASLVLTAGLLATCPAMGQNENTGTSPTTFKQAIDRAVKNERTLIGHLRDRRPVMETYIQELKSDADLGLRPQQDFYFLGHLNMRNGELDPFNLPSHSSITSVPRPLIPMFAMLGEPHGLTSQLYIDLNDFDRQHYNFEYVRREFQGDVRCVVVDVTPRPTAGRHRFKGRIWLEDLEYNIVRFQGGYLPTTNQKIAHFDSWRMNSHGMWLPAYVYSQAEPNRSTFAKTAAVRAQTRLWAYQLDTEKADEAFRDLTSYTSQSGQSNYDDVYSHPGGSSHRQWQEESAQNVIERLQRVGMLAPSGEVDQVLDIVLNNLLLGANIKLDFEVRTRILMTGPMESMVASHTILISRGLIDILPDEATLAGILARELAHIMIGNPMSTKFAFRDELVFPDRAVFDKIHLEHVRAESRSAEDKAIEILKKSPYSDSLPKVGLLFRLFSTFSGSVPHLSKPLLGNAVLDRDTDQHSFGFMGQGSELLLNDKNQISALPLGSRIKIDPWSNELSLMKSTPTLRYTARDSMPLQITPLMINLTRWRPKGK